MRDFISYFFLMDIRMRAAVLMAMLVIVFWWFLGKILIRFASLLPYLLRIAFRGVYLLIEAPVCWIHGRVGSVFYRIDNGLASVGDRIDFFLERWHTRWRNPGSRHIFLSIVIYCVLMLWICLPYRAENADVKLFSGQGIYLRAENKLTDWLESHNLYGEQLVEAVSYEEPVSYKEPEQVEKENITEGIAMMVITNKDPLSIRDIPSTENCEILERIEKGNIVLWEGEMTFGSGSNGGIEPWVKVETPAGTVGWARLIYLCPVNEEDFELKLQW